MIYVVQAKLKGYRVQIAALTRALTAAHTTKANLARMAKGNQEQLDTAIAEVKTKDQEIARLDRNFRLAESYARHLFLCYGDMKYKLTATDLKLDLAKTRLHSEKAQNGATNKQMIILEQRLADSTSNIEELESHLAITKTELVAATKEGAVKDAFIAHQCLEINKTRQLAVDWGKANLELGRTLGTTQIQLKASERLGVFVLIGRTCRMNGERVGMKGIHELYIQASADFQLRTDM